jgi:hypothetical protein
LVTNSEPGEKIRAPGKRPLIEIEDVRVAGSTLIFKVEVDPSLEMFVHSGLFYFRYDLPVDEVPECILSIPLLGCLAPLAWTIGADLAIGDVDSEYLSCVQEIGSQMKKWYPEAVSDIRVVAKPSQTASGWNEGKKGLLYTGGVDSTASMLRNGRAELSLFMIRGTPEIRLYEARYFKRVRESLDPFVRSLGLEIHTVETNALDVINFRLIGSKKKDQFTDGWWENVAHSLVLLSACAPYTYLKGTGKLLIASSFNQVVKAWGSTPTTDQMVKWGGLRVVHDSYDLSRMKKVEQVIAPYARERGGSIPLRVCTGRKSVRLDSGALNCGRCEKCTRTMLQLMFCGLDPARCGFDTTSFVPANIRAELKSGRLKPAHNPNSWRSMFTTANPQYQALEGTYPGLGEFVGWLRTWDFTPKVPLGERMTNLLAPKGSRRRKIAGSVLR